MGRQLKPPAYREVKKTALFFAPGEWVAEWVFFILKRSAQLRLFLEAVALVVFVSGAVGLYLEFEQRQIDRGVRVATLFAQIAQVHALADGGGLAALKPSVTALAREGVNMSGINLSGVDLSGANLRRAILSGANFSGAKLNGTDLSGAHLLGANFAGASMLDTNLSGADITRTNFTNAVLFLANLSKVSTNTMDFIFYGIGEVVENPSSQKHFNMANFSGASLLDTNLSGADMSLVRGLTQKQLDEAFAHTPPKLPIDMQTEKQFKPPPQQPQFNRLTFEFGLP